MLLNSNVESVSTVKSPSFVAREVSKCFNAAFVRIFELVTKYEAQGKEKVMAALHACWATHLLWHLEHSQYARDLELCRRLELRQITWRTISVESYSLPHTVYIKVAKDNDTQYIGLADGGAAARELTRWRKFKQYGLVDKEPALRVWTLLQNYHEFVLIPLSHHKDGLQSLAAETIAIHEWKPRLNFPYVSDLVHELQNQQPRRNMAGEFARPQKFLHMTRKVRRLWKRQRVQSRIIAWQHSDPHWATIKKSHETSLVQAAHILAEISMKNICSFTVQKKLRHHLVTNTDLYALHRSALSLAQPEKGRALREIRSALKSRQLRIPSPATIVKVRNIRPDATKTVKTWIKQSRNAFCTASLPYHPPRLVVVEEANKKIQNILFNYRENTKKIRPTLCSCGKYLQLFTSQDCPVTESGHLVLEPKHLCRVLGIPEVEEYEKVEDVPICYYNINEALWPTSMHELSQWKADLISHLGAKIQKVFSNATWTELKASAESLADTILDCPPPSRSTAHAQQLQQLVTLQKDFIFHMADHQHSKLHAFCVEHYDKVAEKTFGEADIFKKVDATPDIVAKNLWKTTPRAIKQSFRWAFRRRLTRSKLPYGYMLCKPKKKWMKGRSIVSYRRTCYEKILRATGIVLGDLCHEAFKTKHFNCPTAKLVTKKLKQYSAKSRKLRNRRGSLTATEHFQLEAQIIADDLSGFFPSADHQMMLRAVEYILDLSVRTRRVPLEDMRLTFDLHNAKMHQSTHGKSMEQGKLVYPLRHLKTVCEQALRWAIVTYRNTTYWQCKGGAIGSPLSPPWLVSTVMLREHEWLLGLQQPTFAEESTIRLWDVIRYVDNRLVLTYSHGDFSCAPQQLREKTFYGGSLMLEPEPTDEIVGIDIIQLGHRIIQLHEEGNIVECRTKVMGYDATMFPWNELWRYRTAMSAGSDTLNLSSYQTRLHQAVMLSFPEERQREAIARTLWVYRALNYPTDRLIDIASRKRQLLKSTPDSWWQRLFHAVLHAPQSLHDLAGK